MPSLLLPACRQVFISSSAPINLSEASLTRQSSAEMEWSTKRRSVKAVQRKKVPFMLFMLRFSIWQEVIKKGKSVKDVQRKRPLLWFDFQQDMIKKCSKKGRSVKAAQLLCFRIYNKRENSINLDFRQTVETSIYTGKQVPKIKFLQKDPNICEKRQHGADNVLPHMEFVFHIQTPHTSIIVWCQLFQLCIWSQFLSKPKKDLWFAFVPPR